MEQRFLKMHDISTRDADTGPEIEGYFAVFDEIYEVWPGVTESIQPGAFDSSVTQDVRALYNHNSDVILGRVSAGTLELRQDSHGLWGRVKINRNDTEAMNVYERISRGDITGCSFGFDIKSERYDIHEDGSVHYTIEDVDPLYEVSPCVFPAYEATNISSRGRDLDEIKKRRMQSWKDRMMAKLKKGESEDGIKSADDPEEA